jgi:hypothetical protein
MGKGRDIDGNDEASKKCASITSLIHESWGEESHIDGKDEASMTTF